MKSWVDKASSVAQSIAAKAKAVAQGITEIELKVQEATNNDPWGPHGSVMSEIAQAAYDPEKYELIMGVVFQRLQEAPENWRLIYKALLLLEFLCKQGPVRLAEDFRRDPSVLQKLQADFEYKDANGKDQGINVRNRAQELLVLISNPDRLQQEREKAQKNAGKYTGVASYEVRGGGGGAGLSSSNSAQNISSSSLVTNETPEDEEDPFEATRKRIEKLKAEGAIPDAPLTFSSAPSEAAEAAKRQPKKLSDVKVNPQITAVLSNFTPVGSGSMSSVPTTLSSPAGSSLSGLDLLADLDPSAPVTGGGGNALDWDAFAASATAPLAAPAVAPAASSALNLPSPGAPVVDDWSVFASSTVTSEKKAAADLDSLLDIGSSVAPGVALLPIGSGGAPYNHSYAATGSTFGGPLPAVVEPTASTATFDPFAPASLYTSTPAPSSAAPSTSALFTGSQAAAIASQNKLKLGSQAAVAAQKKKDPFSDLAAF